MNSVGVGVIGTGMAVKPHALALADLAGRVRVVGAYSRTEARRREFAASYRMPSIDSIDALLSDPDVQVVLVLTPPRTHADLALRCARAGKHVLLEKPLDVDLPQALATVRAVESMGVQLGVVFQHRFRDGARLLREMLAAGELGELLSVSCAIRWWRSAEYFAVGGRGTLARDGGGVLLTQAIHTLDVLLDLIGPAQRVSALCRTSPLRSIDTEDMVSAVVAFHGGAIGVVDATTTAYPGFPERIELSGSKGTAVLEAERLTVQRPGRDPVRVDGSFAGGGGADPMAFSHEAHRRLIEDFLDALRDRRPPRASGRSALPVHALIDAMLASSRTGLPVDVPRI